MRTTRRMGLGLLVLGLVGFASDELRAQSLDDSLDALAISHQGTPAEFDPGPQGYVNLVRWAFPDAWGFPAGGFDVYRCCDERRALWVQLNQAPIRPIDAATAPSFVTTSPLPEPRLHAGDGRRIPPAWRVAGPVATELVDTVAQAASNPTVVFDPDPNPNNQVGGSTPPSMTRMQLLLMASVYPRLAFALGLMLADYEPALGERCTYRIVGHWTAPRGDQTVYVGPIEMGVEPPLATGNGLTATLIPGPLGSTPPDELHEALVPYTSEVGLRWDLPPLPQLGRYPPEPVLWRVFRSGRLGPVSALPPVCPADPNLYTAITVGADPISGAPVEAPLVVSPRSDSNGDPLLDANGEIVYPRFFYFDRFAGQLAVNSPPVPDYGWYCWRLQGQDLFGRRSALSTPARLNVRDHIAPPPPADLCAVTGVPAMDPYAPLAANVTPQTRAQHRRQRCATKPDVRGVPRFQDLDQQTTALLRWRWTDRQATEAPDAETFEIYRRLGEDSALPPDGVLPNSAWGWTLVTSVDLANPAGGRIQDADPDDPGAQRWNYELAITLTKANTADCRDLHQFRLVTVDTNGNRSLPTPVAASWVIDRRRPQPPGTPQVLYARQPGTGTLQVHLLIPTSPSSDVVGYAAYRSRQAPVGPAPGDGDLLLNGTQASSPTDVVALQTLALAGNLFRSTTGPIHRASAVGAGSVPALAANTVHIVTSVPAATTTTHYHWHAVAHDACANVSDLSPSTGERIPDWDPPSPPVITSALGAEKGVAATPGETRSVVDLVWAANPEPDVAGYIVYRSEGLAACVPISPQLFLPESAGLDLSQEPLLPAHATQDLWRSPSPGSPDRVLFHFRDQDVRPLRLYRYVVRAVDDALNVSNAAQEIRVSTYDLSPPEDASDVTATAAPGRQVTVTWLAAEAHLRARVQRAITPLGPFVTVNDSDPELSSTPEGNGFRYTHLDAVPTSAPDRVYYRVQLIDISGNESAPALFDPATDGSADPVDL